MTECAFRLCIAAECSASANVFVLDIHHEGWISVLLEVVSCGRPVVACDVGGNAEVVGEDSLGTLGPFGADAVIRRCTERNAWDLRAQALVKEFHSIHAPSRAVCASLWRSGHV